MSESISVFKFDMNTTSYNSLIQYKTVVIKFRVLSKSARRLQYQDIFYTNFHHKFGQF